MWIRVVPCPPSASPFPYSPASPPRSPALLVAADIKGGLFVWAYDTTGAKPEPLLRGAGGGGGAGGPQQLGSRVVALAALGRYADSKVSFLYPLVYETKL